MVYRQAVYVPASSSATFDPPIDAIFVIAQKTNQTVNATVDGAVVPLPRLPAGTTFDVPNCTSVAADNTFAYLGLRFERHVENSIVELDEGG